MDHEILYYLAYCLVKTFCRIGPDSCIFALDTYKILMFIQILLLHDPVNFLTNSGHTLFGEILDSHTTHVLA